MRVGFEKTYYLEQSDNEYKEVYILHGCPNLPHPDSVGVVDKKTGEVILASLAYLHEHKS